jgi:branched-chain amino acid transport system permease protein
MIELLGGLIQLTGPARLVSDVALYFGLFVIVAMALNFQYGNAGIPNMGCAVQVIVGGFTVSAITTRLLFIITNYAGKELLPWSTDNDWIYNNPTNVGIVNEYLKSNVLLAVALFLFTLSFSMIMGACVGWLMSLPAIRLRATYLMIVLITMADAAQLIGRNVSSISGGTLGMFVPNVFIWYPGDRAVILAITTLILGILVFMIFRNILNSPYGRLMRAVRENEYTVESVGKNVVLIRRNILMFASSITSLSGVLLAFYYSFVVEANYSRQFWTYWPWLMLIVGGPGNNAGTFLGCALIVIFRRLIVLYKWQLEQFLFFPVSFLENIFLGILLLSFIILRPDGIIPEKLIYVKGIKYYEIIQKTLHKNNKNN